MTKGDSVKQVEVDLQKLMQDVSVTNPPAVLYVNDAQDIEGISLLQLDASTEITEVIGIPFVFELTKFDVMKARALAFGVVLERRYT
ncbi:MAG: hypothetical protein KGL95_15700 [Patescibacteria group bacterium]|nr:hypothetical protein [Patescibacteria group bacterium]